MGAPHAQYVRSLTSGVLCVFWDAHLVFCGRRRAAALACGVVRFIGRLLAFTSATTKQKWVAVEVSNASLSIQQK